MGIVAIYKRTGQAADSSDLKWVKETQIDSDEMEAYVRDYIESREFKQPFFITEEAAGSTSRRSGSGLCSDCGHIGRLTIVNTGSLRNLL